ncbi:MAG: TspO/MBR family protein [Chitinophagales bacterium]
MWYKVIIFLVLNFLALGIGGFATGDGVSSQWYAELNKAPWTPPGWVFGAAWTLIMICFSFFMAFLWKNFENKKLLIGLYSLQWVLCVGWNFVFFEFQQIFLGLFVIGSLFLLTAYFLLSFWPQIQAKSLLVAPYFVWLLIATSLNFYILLNN